MILLSCRTRRNPLSDSGGFIISISVRRRGREDPEQSLIQGQRMQDTDAKGRTGIREPGCKGRPELLRKRIRVSCFD